MSQVRNGQLEKEARELRAENSSLLADVESSTQATATSQQVPAAVHRLTPGPVRGSGAATRTQLVSIAQGLATC